MMHYLMRNTNSRRNCRAGDNSMEKNEYYGPISYRNLYTYRIWNTLVKEFFGFTCSVLTFSRKMYSCISCVITFKTKKGYSECIGLTA